MKRCNITSSLNFGPLLYKCIFWEKNHNKKGSDWALYNKAGMGASLEWPVVQSQIYLMFHKPSEGNMLGLLQIQGFLACANNPLSSLLTPHG